jgi:hypothetical protein
MFLFSIMPQPVLGPIQPLIPREPGFFFSKGKVATCKVDHSPPPSVQVKSA